MADRTNHADWATAAVLHQRYLKEVFQYVSRRVPREEADNVTMQVFATAVEALPRFRGECPPRIWLLKIARGKVVDMMRRRASRREILASEMADAGPETDPIANALAAAAEGPAAAFERAEARRMIRRLVDQLNKDQREALLLQYVEELSVAEIAVIMGRSAAAIDSLLQRARATLFRLGRSYFLDDGEEAQRCTSESPREWEAIAAGRRGRSGCAPCCRRPTRLPSRTRRWSEAWRSWWRGTPPGRPRAIAARARHPDGDGLARGG